MPSEAAVALAPFPPSVNHGRILIIDDQPALRAGLARLITARFTNRIEVHTASSPAAALQKLALTIPQVAVLDVDLAGHDGLALIPCMPSECKVLVLSSHNDMGTRTRAMSLGAALFLEKGQPASKVIACLATLLPTGMQGEHPPGASGASSAAPVNRPL